MNPLVIGKLASQFVASVGVTKVIGDIITANTTVLKRGDTAKIWVGSFMLGSMAVEASVRHIDRMVEEWREWHKNHKIEIVETNEETE